MLKNGPIKSVECKEKGILLCLHPTGGKFHLFLMHLLKKAYKTLS